MTARPAATIAVDTPVAATPDAVYDLITDLSTLAQLAEETEAMRWVSGDRARPGAVFKGDNRNGRHTWTTTCTVTDAQPGRAFAWDVRGSRVTECMWDNRPWWLRRFGVVLTGTPDRAASNADHMRVTLQRLKAHAESR